MHGFNAALSLQIVDPPIATLTFTTGVNGRIIVGRRDTQDGVTHGYRRIGDGEHSDYLRCKCGFS